MQAAALGIFMWPVFAIMCLDACLQAYHMKIVVFWYKANSTGFQLEWFPYPIQAAVYSCVFGFVLFKK